MSQRGTRAAKTAAAGFAKRVLSSDIYSLVIPPSNKPVSKKQAVKLVESSKPGKSGTDNKAGSASPRSRSPRAESPRLRTSRSKSPAADEATASSGKDAKKTSAVAQKAGSKTKKGGAQTDLSKPVPDSGKRSATSNKNTVSSLNKKAATSTGKKGAAEGDKKAPANEAGKKPICDKQVKSVESDLREKSCSVSTNKRTGPDTRGLRSRAGSEAKLQAANSASESEEVAAASTSTKETEEPQKSTQPKFAFRRGRPRKGQHVPREPVALDDTSVCGKTASQIREIKPEPVTTNQKTAAPAVITRAVDIETVKTSTSSLIESSPPNKSGQPVSSVTSSTSPSKSPVPKVTFITVDGQRIPINCKLLESVQSTSSIVNQILQSAGVMSPTTSPAKGGSSPRLSPHTTSSPPAKANVYKLMLNSKNQAALSTINPKQLIDSLSKSDKDKIFTVKILPTSSAAGSAEGSTESCKSPSSSVVQIHTSPSPKITRSSAPTLPDVKVTASTSPTKSPSAKERPSILAGGRKKIRLLDEKLQSQGKEVGPGVEGKSDVNIILAPAGVAMPAPLITIKEEAEPNESPQAMECEETSGKDVSPDTETPVKIKIECPSPVETIQSVAAMEASEASDWFLSPVKHPTELITKNKFFQIFGLYDKAKVEAEKGKSKMHRAAGGKLRRTIKSRICPEMVYGNFLVTKTGILEGIPDSWSSGEDTDGEIDPAKLAKQLHLLDEEQTKKLGISRKMSLLSMQRAHSAPTTPERRNLLGETSTLCGLKENEPPYLAKRKISFGPKSPKKEWLKPKIIKKSPELHQISKSLDKKKSGQKDSNEKATKTSKDSSEKSTNKNGPSKSHKKKSDSVKMLQVKSKSFDSSRPSTSFKGKLEKSKSFSCKSSVIKDDSSESSPGKSKTSKTVTNKLSSIKEEAIDDPNARRSARQRGKRKEWWHLLRANPDEFEVDKKWEEEIEETEKRKVAREEKRRKLEIEDEDSVSSVITIASSKEENEDSVSTESKEKCVEDAGNKGKKKSEKDKSEKASGKKETTDVPVPKKKTKENKRKAGDDKSEGTPAKKARTDNDPKPDSAGDVGLKLEEEQQAQPKKKKKKKKKKKAEKDDSENSIVSKYQFHENGAILTRDSADDSRAFLILGPDGKPLSKEEHTAIYEELKDVLQKIMDNPETFHEAGAIELALGKHKKDLVKGSQFSKATSSPSISDGSLVSEENGVGYQCKESQCITPHMCPVCWINDHMYCRNMKRIGSHLAPNAGCIHYMPCMHYKFLRNNPAEYTPGGTFITPSSRALSDGTSVTIRGGRVLCKRPPPSPTANELIVTRKPSSLPSCRTLSLSKSASRDGVDLFCHEELLESDSEPNSPPSEPGTEILRCQIKARAVHIARSLGVEDKELLRDNVDLSESFSPVKMASVVVDDVVGASQKQVEVEEYGAEVTVGDISDSEDEDLCPVPLKKCKSNDPWNVHPDHETHINIEINSGDKDKGTNIRLIPYADLKNTPQYIDIKGKKHRFIKIKVQKVDPRKFKSPSESAGLSTSDKEKQTNALREFIAKSADKVLREMDGEGQINLRLSDESGGFSIVNSQEDGDLSIQCEELSKDDLDLGTSAESTEPRVLWSSQLDMLKSCKSPNSDVSPERSQTTAEKSSPGADKSSDDNVLHQNHASASKGSSKPRSKVQFEILEESEDGEQKVVKIVTAVDPANVALNKGNDTDPNKSQDKNVILERSSAAESGAESGSCAVSDGDIAEKPSVDDESGLSDADEVVAETWKLCEITGKYVQCTPGGTQAVHMSAHSEVAVTSGSKPPPSSDALVTDAAASSSSSTGNSPTVSPIAKFSISSSLPPVLPTISEAPAREMLSGEPVRITSKMTNLPEPLRKQVTPGEDGSQVLTFTTKDIREQRPELMAYIKKAKLVGVIKNTLLQEKTTLQKMIKDGEKSLKEAQLLLIKNEAATSPEAVLSSLKSEISMVQGTIAAAQQSMNVTQAAQARIKRRKAFFEAKAENLRKRLQMCIESLNRIIVMEEEEEEEKPTAKAEPAEISDSSSGTEQVDMMDHFPPYMLQRPTKVQPTGKTQLAHYIQQKQQKQHLVQQPSSLSEASPQLPMYPKPMLPGQSQKLLAIGQKQLLTYTVSSPAPKGQKAKAKQPAQSTEQTTNPPTTSELVCGSVAAVVAQSGSVPSPTTSSADLVRHPSVVEQNQIILGTSQLQPNEPVQVDQILVPQSIAQHLLVPGSMQSTDPLQPSVMTSAACSQNESGQVLPTVLPSGILTATQLFPQVMGTATDMPPAQPETDSSSIPQVPVQQTGSIKFIQNHQELLVSKQDAANSGAKLAKPADLPQITILSVPPPGLQPKQEQARAIQKIQEQLQQHQQKQPLLLPPASMQPQLISPSTPTSALNLPTQMPISMFTLPTQQQLAGGQKQILTYTIPPVLQQNQQQQLLQGQPQVLTYTAFPPAQPLSPTAWKQPFPKPMKVVSLPVIQRNLPVQGPGSQASGSPLTTQSTQLLGIKSPVVTSTLQQLPVKPGVGSTSMTAAGHALSKPSYVLPVSGDIPTFVIPQSGVSNPQQPIALDSRSLRKPFYVLPSLSVATASSHAPVTMTHVQPSMTVSQSSKSIMPPSVATTSVSIQQQSQPSVIVQPIADVYSRATIPSGPCGVNLPGVHDHSKEACLDPVACAQLAQTVQSGSKSNQVVGAASSSGADSVLTYTFVLGSQSMTQSVNPVITKTPQLPLLTSPVYSSPLSSIQSVDIKMPTAVTETTESSSESPNTPERDLISEPLPAQASVVSATDGMQAPDELESTPAFSGLDVVPFEVEPCTSSPSLMPSPLLASSPVCPEDAPLSIPSELLSDQTKSLPSQIHSPLSSASILNIPSKIGSLPSSITAVSPMTVVDQAVVSDSQVVCAQLVSDHSTKAPHLTTYELLAPQAVILDDEPNGAGSPVMTSEVSVVTEPAVPITSPISEWLVTDTELNSTIIPTTNIVIEQDASIPYTFSRPATAPITISMLTPDMRRQLSLDSTGNSLMDESDTGLPSSQDTIGSDIYEELAFEDVSSSIL